MAVMQPAGSSTYRFVHFGVGEGKGGSSAPFYAEMESNKILSVAEDSKFATSTSYPNQLFYTGGGQVFRYVNASNASDAISFPLYDVGVDKTIVAMKFRCPQESVNWPAYKMAQSLAIAVNTADGKGEIHELFLTTSGDVERTAVYTGFGPIKDIEYVARIQATL